MDWYFVAGLALGSIGLPLLCITVGVLKEKFRYDGRAKTYWKNRLARFFRLKGRWGYDKYDWEDEKKA